MRRTFLIVSATLNANKHNDAKIRNVRWLTIALNRLNEAKTLEPSPKASVLFMEVIIGARLS